MVSIIIATKNRPEKIVSCVHSILCNACQAFEIIIVDQSDTRETQTAVEKMGLPLVRYFVDKGSGKSPALNVGISHAKGEIVAFTDDDCMVDKRWVQTIQSLFLHHVDIDAVFGKTAPYNKGKKPGRFCPAIIDLGPQHIIEYPCIHYESIGFGNNMAIRKSAFDHMKAFKPWLGPGSVGYAAEDAEVSLRLLLSGKKILYSPLMVIYHNKWLNDKEMKMLQLTYTCGEMACYGYFTFQGYSFAKPIVKDVMADSYYKLRKLVASFLSLRWNRKLFLDVWSALVEIFYKIRGLFIALLFSFTDPIPMVSK